MVIPKHRAMEFRVLDMLWRQGPLSMREILEHLPEEHRPAYETLRSVIYRLQERKAIRRVRKIANSQIFEASLPRQEAQEQLIDDFASLFADDIGTLIGRLMDTGRLTLDDLREAQRRLDPAPPARAPRSRRL
jgi:predicted transcriptional regulator